MSGIQADQRSPSQSSPAGVVDEDEILIATITYSNVGSRKALGPPSDRGPRRRDRDNSDEDMPPRRAAKTAIQGTIRETLPNAMYSVELDNGQKVLSHMATTLQTRTVRILPGDRVTVELSPYDPLRGRITQRHR
jgi:translation initiation factor IF-1